ncbi:hypothetical protein K6V78_05025 [Streptococcus gallolyticus]|uniref:hypothetical protein n=1 Tax=Streptococcus hepaticus TaxID=3349163 RepID=UPI001C949B7F|nr:hypothetical protein [Streptococcus gallolyticus]MBY5040996.1 hypothetical protein [Streptococcus gallolyticus]
MKKKESQGVVFDERQQQFVLKSYKYGFWFTIFILWLSFFVLRFLANVVSAGFMISIAFWGGICLQTSYAILKGAHPLVDNRFKRFGRFGKWFGLFAFLYGIAMTVFSLFDPAMTKFNWKEFFSYGETGMMLALSLSLMVTGFSLVCRKYLDKKEEED